MVNIASFGIAHGIPLPGKISSYEYEIEACLRALEAGSIECPRNAARANPAHDGDHG